METPLPNETSFFRRLAIALAGFRRALGNPAFCRQLELLLHPPEPVAAKKPPELPPERVHAPALFMLGMLQREGRLIDFLQEDVSSFPDADIGSAARVVHAGCRKALAQCLSLDPILNDAEGAAVSVSSGFDAQRIRLTGNITGQPPFRGALKHHGWVVTSVRLPEISASLDPRVLAPAEVELS